MTEKDLKPTLLWENFKQICKIPHPSEHEEEICKWLLSWAKEHGIAAKQDKVGNIVLSKPATAGMENRKGVVLQGHIDMVPQKNADKVHDFTKDPIEMVIGDDGWVRANGTTLGADNGIGCAAAMAVLQSKDLEHGPIEVLVTVTEETGMTGAFGLEAGLLKGDILINLDSEDEGELYVGCAGGMDANFTMNYSMEKTPDNMQGIEIAITGLKGGHSGMDINSGRANANKLLMRLLKKASQFFDMHVASINGGSLRNAIPREAFATIAIPSGKMKEFNEFITAFTGIVSNEFSVTEPDLSVSAKATDTPKEVISRAEQEKIINLVYAIPNGVMRMSDSMSGLVETSTNLAIVKAENGKLLVANLLRSSVDTAKAALGYKMEAIAALAGVEIELEGAYPGWKPNMDSAILKTMMQTYESLYGKTPEIKAIHAGLECGLLGGVYPHWDMISFGPTIRNP
ncbi:MAG: aminoacyl-histidine dipeptidase, partial [Lentimicrobiaceae bacterium]|nr:aminoacyl-histidine dipeptidase [Lentimicrobiaceae bacterium]